MLRRTGSGQQQAASRAAVRHLPNDALLRCIGLITALILTTVSHRSSDLRVRDYHRRSLFERITWIVSATGFSH